MPFGVTGTPPTFQAHINDCLWPDNDKCAVRCLGHALLYSSLEEKHKEQIPTVLKWQQEFGLYSEANQCHFGDLAVWLVGLRILPNTIAIKSDSRSTIENWPTIGSVWDVQVCLRFMNVYWHLTRQYAMATMPIADQPKNAGNSRMSILVKWECTRDAELTFQKLNRAFSKAPILKHFEPAEPIILQTDACHFTITIILIQ